MRRAAAAVLAGLSAVLAFALVGERAAAQSADAAVRSRVTARSGVARYRAGRWSQLRIETTNTGEQPADVRSTTYFAVEPNLQFSRDLTVPAGAVRRAWNTVRVPEALARQAGFAEMRTLTEQRTADGFRRTPPPEGGLWGSDTTPLYREPLVAAAIFDAPGDIADDAYQVGLSVLASRQLAPILYGMEGDFLPPTVEALSTVDVLIIAGDRIGADAAGAAAVRAWVHEGGRLWILLDRVSQETVRLLAGDLFTYDVVDRVGLTRFAVQDSGNDGPAAASAIQEHETPVDLVRVLAKGVDVLHTVNNWPASFRVKSGDGQIVCTALAPRAWMRTRTPRDPPASPLNVERFVAATPLLRLAKELIEPQPTKFEPERFAPFLSEQVGYRILDRTTALGILAGYCGVVAAAGFWLARRNQLARLGIVGPAAGVLAAGVFVLLGGHARRSVPPTLAVFEHVAVEASGTQAQLRGLVAMYHPSPSSDVPEATGGGFYWPDLTGLLGDIRRRVRTDLETWHWEGLRLPAGVHFAPFRRTLPLDQPLVARGVLGPEGLSGSVSGPLSGMADGLAAMPSGERLALRLDASGGFTAGTEDALPRGQYLASSLMSDAQRRRQSVYAQILAERPDPAQPYLYVWADPLDTGLAVGEDVRKAGSALVALPLEIAPTPPGESVLTPSPLISYRAVTRADAFSTPAFSNATGEWVRLNRGAETWLRFQLPTQVLPLAPSRAALTIELDAPERPVETLGLVDNRPVVLHQVRSPQGRIRIAIDRTDVLRPDAQGGIVLGVRVNSSGDESPARLGAAQPVGTEWKIESVALEVSGAVLPRP